MPIWLRRHTFIRIKEHKEAEADAYKNAGKGGRSSAGKKGKQTTDIDLGKLADKKKIKTPSDKFRPPTYISKASKK